MIALQKIEKRFGDNPILRGVDLTVPEGKVTALIGPSGSGKSTLLRCVNLLEIPQAGTLVLGDQRLDFRPGAPPARRDVLAVRRQTGMVFQNFQLFPHRTVIENITEGLITVGKWPKEAARVRALELLDRVGLAQKAEAWPASLSAASSSAWRSPGRWPPPRACCSATSRPRRSIPSSPPRWWTCWPASPARA
jgi:L-cystine transport system ATP-binding protein